LGPTRKAMSGRASTYVAKVDAISYAMRWMGEAA